MTVIDIHQKAPPAPPLVRQPRIRRGFLAFACALIALAGLANLIRASRETALSILDSDPLTISQQLLLFGPVMLGAICLLVTACAPRGFTRMNQWLYAISGILSVILLVVAAFLGRDNSMLAFGATLQQMMALGACLQLASAALLSVAVTEYLKNNGVRT